MTSKGYSTLGNPANLITQSQIIKKLGEATRRLQRQPAPKLGLETNFLTGATPVFCKPILKASNATNLLAYRLEGGQPRLPISRVWLKQNSYSDSKPPLRQTVHSLSNGAKLVSINAITNEKTMETSRAHQYNTNQDLAKILDVINAVSNKLIRTQGIHRAEAGAIVLQVLQKRASYQSQLDHIHKENSLSNSKAIRYVEEQLAAHTQMSQTVSKAIDQELERVFGRMEAYCVTQTLKAVMIQNDLREKLIQRFGQTLNIGLKSIDLSEGLSRKRASQSRLREVGPSTLNRLDNRFSVRFHQANHTPHRNSFQRYTQPLDVNVVDEEDFNPKELGQIAENQTSSKQSLSPSKKTSLSIKEVQRPGRLHLLSGRFHTQFTNTKKSIPYVTKASKHLPSMTAKSSTKTRVDYLSKVKAQVNTGLSEWGQAQFQRLRLKSKHWKLRLGEGLTDVDAAFKLKMELANIKLDNKRSIKLKKIDDGRQSTLDSQYSQQAKGGLDIERKSKVSKQTIGLLARGFRSGNSWSLPQVKQQVMSLLFQTEHTPYLTDFHEQFLRSEERLEWCQRECRSWCPPKPSEVNTVEYPLDNIYDLAFRRQIKIQEPYIRPDIPNFLVDCYEQNEVQNDCLDSNNGMLVCPGSQGPSELFLQVKMDPLLQTQLHCTGHYRQGLVFAGDRSRSQAS